MVQNAKTEEEGYEKEEAGGPEHHIGEEPPEEKSTIDKMAEMDDESLHHVLGHKKELETVRQGIKEAQALTGKAREHAEGKVHDMLTPKIYPSDFRYLAEDAKRHVKMTAKEAMNDTSPGSVM